MPRPVARVMVGTDVQRAGETNMSVAKVIEITSASNESFEDAIRQGVAKASEPCAISRARG
jgi:flavin-binding protein dodecin